MNSRQLQKLGVPEGCVKSAIAAIQIAMKAGDQKGKQIKQLIIACRMKLSVLDLPPSSLAAKFNLYREALDGGTRFGIGSTHQTPQDHPVMDQDWSVSGCASGLPTPFIASMEQAMASR